MNLTTASNGLPTLRPSIPSWLPDLRSATTMMRAPDRLFEAGAHLARTAHTGAFRVRVGYDRWTVITDPSWFSSYASLGPEDVDPFEFRLRMPSLHIPGLKPPADIVETTKLSREALARRCTPAAVASYTDALLAALDGALARTERSRGQLDDCFEFFLRCLVDMVSVVLLGPELAESLPPGLADNYCAVERGLNLRSLIAPNLPSLKSARSRRAKVQIGDAWRELAAQRRELGPGAGDNLVHDLLDARLPDGSAIDDDTLAWMLNSIHWAAHRYPAVHAYWIGAELQAQLDVYARALAEQAAIPTLDEAGLDRMTYLRGCIRESLRLHPLICLPRRLKRTLELQGQRLEAGETLVLSPYLVHHRVDQVPDSMSFRPERWAEGEALPRGAFIPGGLGRWGCVGMRLTERMLTLLWARLLRTHELELADRSPDFRQGMIISPPRRRVGARLSARA